MSPCSPMRRPPSLPEENAAAQTSLVRMKGDAINAAILSALEPAAPKVRASLLAALAARNAKEAFPAVLAGTRHTDQQVRMAALAAIRYLAEDKDAGSVVDVVKSCTTEEERGRAELALRASVLGARTPAYRPSSPVGTVPTPNRN